MNGLPAASFSITGFRCFASCAASVLACVAIPAISNAMQTDLMPLTSAMSFLPGHANGKSRRFISEPFRHGVEYRLISSLGSRMPVVPPFAKRRESLQIIRQFGNQEGGRALSDSSIESVPGPIQHDRRAQAMQVFEPD